MSHNEEYTLKSRGYKTRGRTHKHKYRNDIICPECGKDSVYRNEMGRRISYKCLSRSCKYQWYGRVEEDEE